MVSKDRIALIVVVIVLVIVLGVVFFLSQSKNSSRNTTGTATVASSSPSGTPTRAVVPQNIVVPEKGESSTPANANVAIPQVQAVASPSNNSSYRSFSITAQNGSFTPDTIIVNNGDSVDLAITALGGAYDFTQPDYGFHVAIPDGKTVKVDFQATATGKFTFYCSSCGGPSKGPVGYLEVVAGSN